MASTFTVYFEDPFWVGVLEIHGPDGARAARHVFGGEPGGAEIWDFVRCGGFDRLLDTALASQAAGEPLVPRRNNPKRAAREVARQRAARPLTTAAQEALSQAHEESARLNKAAVKRRRVQDAMTRLALAQEKAKKRRRGR